jgi:putative ABC transport system permease protein
MGGAFGASKIKKIKPYINNKKNKKREGDYDMFGNYIKLALRNLFKNRLYATINVVGLTIGLTVYLFANLMAEYENTHDAFFEKADHIFSVGSIVNPAADMGIKEIDAVFSAVGPLIKTDLNQDVEGVARTIRRQYLLSVGDKHFYQDMIFADTDFTKIFDFNYISGDGTVINDPSSIIITKSMAEKLFPGENPMGKTITLDHKDNLTIAAVIEDLPANSHFGSSLVNEQKFQFVASLQAYERISSWSMEGQWSNLSMGNNTYVLTKNIHDKAWLQTKIDGIYERHVSEERQELISGFRIRSVVEINSAVWDMIGIPVIGSIKILSIMILIVACVNYTNLATAQTLRRTREVGLRKALGAGKPELLAQFLIESVTVTLLAMFAAIAILELIIPLFNEASGKVVALDYAGILPWLTMTTLSVGLLAGAYPSYLITRTNAIEALRDLGSKGKGSSRFRSIMVGLQFGLSIFMLAGVTVMYTQNIMLKESSNIFPKDQVVNLNRINTTDIRPRWETLKTQLKALPGVEDVSLVSQIPFDQSTSAVGGTQHRGDKATEVPLNILAGDEDFITTFDMKLIAGRYLSKDVARDTMIRNDEREITVFELNVLVNELALSQLGFASPDAAVGQIFYDIPEERETIVYTIVGVVKDVNFMGLWNGVKSNVIYNDPLRNNYMSIKMKGGMIPKTIEDIEATWKEIVPDYPIQRAFLSETFEGVFGIFKALNAALAIFAAVALLLALIGLFGLAAFMAQQRTKEIGLRKVMGAKVSQIIKLLIWQFSIPVFGALVIALPLSYLSSSVYLDFFSDRIPMPIVSLLMTGAIAILLSWITVAIHAARVAHTNPINALRYE